MAALIRFLVLLCIALVVSGCSGSDSRFDNSVNIDNLRFEPRIRTVPAGTTVTWHNVDNTTHSVTSGTLRPVVGVTQRQVTIVSSGYIPQVLQVNVGDTVRWNNTQLGTHQIQFVQDQGIDFVSRPFGQGESVDLQIFRAGSFDYSDAFDPSVQGTIVAEGVPDPDGSFDSEGIAPGQSFSLSFMTPGRFTYFCKFHNVEEGEIVVQ